MDATRLAPEEQCFTCEDLPCHGEKRPSPAPRDVGDGDSAEGADSEADAKGLSELDNGLGPAASRVVSCEASSDTSGGPSAPASSGPSGSSDSGSCSDGDGKDKGGNRVTGKRDHDGGSPRRGLKRARTGNPATPLFSGEAEPEDYEEVYRRFARQVARAQAAGRHAQAHGAMTRVKSENGGEGDGDGRQGGDELGQKRRMARNFREQKRAHRISDVIDQLKGSLDHAGFPIGSSSKFHVLKAAAGYIRSLQHKERCFRMEQEVLTQLQARKQSSADRMHPQHLELLGRLRTAAESAHAIQADRSGADGARPDGSSGQPAVALVPVDYSKVFMGSRVAMCLAGLDGRIVYVNRMFELVMGYTSEEARHMTVFSLVPTECLQGTYEAVGQLLETADRDTSGGGDSTGSLSGLSSGSSGQDGPAPVSQSARSRSTHSAGFANRAPRSNRSGSSAAATSTPSTATSHSGSSGSGEARKKRAKTSARCYATFAKPKRGHSPYVDTGAVAQHGRVYTGGTSDDRTKGASSKYLTTALSATAAPSLAALLGLNQLCASISVVAAPSGFTRTPGSPFTDASYAESFDDQNAGRVTSSSSSGSEGGSDSTAQPRQSHQPKKADGARLFHVSILEAPRPQGDAPSASLTMKMFDADDEDDG